jgi:hypothetical protein
MDFELQRYRGGGERIVDVVLSGDRVTHVAENVIAAPYRKRRTERFVVSNVVCRNIRLGRQSVGHTSAFDVRER